MDIIWLLWLFNHCHEAWVIYGGRRPPTAGAVTHTNAHTYTYKRGHTLDMICLYIHLGLVHRPSNTTTHVQIRWTLIWNKLGLRHLRNFYRCQCRRLCLQTFTVAGEAGPKNNTSPWNSGLFAHRVTNGSERPLLGIQALLLCNSAARRWRVADTWPLCPNC